MCVYCVLGSHGTYTHAPTGRLAVYHGQRRQGHAVRAQALGAVGVAVAILIVTATDVVMIVVMIVVAVVVIKSLRA